MYLRVFCILSVFFTGCINVSYEVIGSSQHWTNLQKNAIGSSQLSIHTQNIIHRYDKQQVLRENPKEVLLYLKDRVDDHPDVCLAISELCYFYAKEEAATEKKLFFYEQSMRWAYGYLFFKESTPSRYDPRFRLLCDLYNQALLQCLRFHEEAAPNSEGQPIQLPVSDWQVSYHGFLREQSDFGEIHICADFEIAGMQLHRTYGLGVPLVISRVYEGDPREALRSAQGLEQFKTPRESFPATAFARIDHGKIYLEIHNPIRSDHLTVDNQKIPMEADFTTNIVHQFMQSQLEAFAFIGLLSIDDVEDIHGLFFKEPYEKGKIPVVMVHGLMSTPLTWMQMVNDLQAIPEIRKRYQFWVFVYPTALPIVYSASLLRERLKTARDMLDPEHQDPALDNMLIVGHSMGGLLSKLMTQTSGEKIWGSITDQEMNKIEDLTDQDREFLSSLFYFEALPFIKRAVFIAAPHQGSDWSTGFLGQIGHFLIGTPKRFLELKDRLLKVIRVREKFALRKGEAPTSIRGLGTNNPMLKIIHEIPIEVVHHSIIGSVEDVPKEQSTDGVVEYFSSHLDSATSEKIISGDHTQCTGHPDAIREVERIMLLHLKGIDSKDSKDK